MPALLFQGGLFLMVGINLMNGAGALSAPGSDDNAPRRLSGDEFKKRRSWVDHEFNESQGEYGREGPEFLGKRPARLWRILGAIFGSLQDFGQEALETIFASADTI